jgi:hypothetical protein
MGNPASNFGKASAIGDLISDTDESQPLTDRVNFRKSICLNHATF